MLSPSAYPPRTISYILTAYNLASGCPKPSNDTVLVTVLPRIIPFAGNDTAVVVNQPLQLQASGGVNYQWIPGNYLSSPAISNPVAVFNEPASQIRYKVLVYNSIGCVDSSSLSVKVYASMPTVYVPTAFTPNHDGLNDQLRPVAVGFKYIEYFQIYNRWGQRVFETRINGAGWDGTVNGQPQASNTYVWMVKAVDFTGKAYFSKGLVTLIR
jgi:gliding motility-associated-like protein